MYSYEGKKSKGLFIRTVLYIGNYSEKINSLKFVFLRYSYNVVEYYTYML